MIAYRTSRPACLPGVPAGIGRALPGAQVHGGGSASCGFVSATRGGGCRPHTRLGRPNSVAEILVFTPVVATASREEVRGACHRDPGSSVCNDLGDFQGSFFEGTSVPFGGRTRTICSQGPVRWPKCGDCVQGR